MRNIRFVVIEGDATIDPSVLRVLIDSADRDIHYIFTSRCDSLSPEALATVVAPSAVARAVFSYDVGLVVSDLKQKIEKNIKRLTEALDRLDADPDEAMRVINEIERELRAARARINGARAAKKRSEDGAD